MLISGALSTAPIPDPEENGIDEAEDVTEGRIVRAIKFSNTRG